MTLDQQIAAMNPGQSIRISGNDQVWVTVERSGNGKSVSFVRHTQNSSTVFKTSKF